MNEALWIGMIAANFAAILVAYRLFGKAGLYAWIPLAVIVANIQVLKTVDLFGVTATLGNVVYATSFLATDLLSENHGRREARRAVFIGFFSLVVMTALMNLAIHFRPSSEDFAHESIRSLFSLMPRVAGASLLAYGVSQLHDVWAFHFWKRRFPGKRFLWLRNNASTMVSQLIDSVVFSLVAFAGVYSGHVLIEIVATTYVLKWIVAALDTPLVYLGRRWWNAGVVPAYEINPRNSE